VNIDGAAGDTRQSAPRAPRRPIFKGGNSPEAAHAASQNAEEDYE
jgi:hypothetical protein